MAKKMKMPRGFYRECMYRCNPRKERIKIIEFWLEHNTDSSKDIRFYVNWQPSDELWSAMQYLGLSDKSDYKDHTWIRHLPYPRTRTQKAIFKSRFSSLWHLNELIGDAEINGMIEKFNSKLKDVEPKMHDSNQSG